MISSGAESEFQMKAKVLRKDFLRGALGLPLLLGSGPIGTVAEVSEELGKYYSKKRYEPSPLPEFEATRRQLPSPFYDARPDWIAMYWKSWQLAFHNFHEPAPGSGYVSQFIDAAFNANIFLWDSCFMP